MFNITNHQGNVKQNYNEISSHTCQDGYHQKEHNKCWQGVEKRELSHTVGWYVNWCSHCAKQYGGFQKKLKIELPYDSAIPLLSIYPKKMKITQKDTCTPMFIAALFTIAKYGSSLSVPQQMNR